MNQHENRIGKIPLKVKFSTFILLMMAPVNFLFVTKLPVAEFIPIVKNEFIIYLALVYAAISPLLASKIEQGMIKNYNSGNRKAKLKTADALYTHVTLIKNGMTCLAYCLGFFAFLLTRDLSTMLWFYPIGIFWSIIYWPTKKRYEKFIAKVNYNEPE